METTYRAKCIVTTIIKKEGCECSPKRKNQEYGRVPL